MKFLLSLALLAAGLVIAKAITGNPYRTADVAYLFGGATATFNLWLWRHA